MTDDVIKTTLCFFCFQEVQILETTLGKVETECPICHLAFPADEVEFHASFCGESLINRPACSPKPSQDLVNSSHPVKSEEDFLQWLSCQVDTSREFHLCISRANMFQRGLKLWQRQKNATPDSQLKITFLGEAGVDSGALRKEFLTEMMAGIEQYLFEGEEGKGKAPKYSLNDLDNGHFRAAGQIFAVSLAQGGPAPKFLQEWCFTFIVTGELNVSKDNIYDPEFSQIVTEVEEASDLADLTESIVNCGYTGQVTSQHKESIIRAILLHATMRKTPMLRDICEGLKLYNLLEVLQRNPSACKGLFLPEKEAMPDSDFLMLCLKPEMSPKGSVKEIREMQILNFFQDFLQELEDESPENLQTKNLNASGLLEQKPLSVPHIMQWLTGQAHKPLLLSEREEFKITVYFDHSCLERMPGHRVCYPVVSACTKTITFPTEHLRSYDAFKDLLNEAFLCGGEFSRL
ncbi:G2/M phase-specific E3 ubiquitin-protein ligase-like [Paramormyrops kingsleyae]|uniref:G2/M phase-specific E3 ubiquitin-protein ligase-like n=1 Tax=Paramormyrops kingsleyae TaxID=1676925 RepID=UPI003B96FC4B